MAACDNPNRSFPEEVPAQGRIENQRSATHRQVPVRPKKQYPPGPPGKVLIFRTIHGRVVPMWVDP